MERKCEKCSKRDYEPNPYVSQLQRVYMLQEGGYPFSPDFAEHMEIEFWFDLAVFRQKMAARMYNPVDPDPAKRPENQRKKIGARG